jgi:hypothetical protein
LKEGVSMNLTPVNPIVHPKPTSRMFSQRTNWDLSPNALQVVLDRVRAHSLPIIDLTESNPTRIELNYPQAQILDAFNDPRSLRYDPQPFGLPDARNAVCAYYNS